MSSPIQPLLPDSGDCQPCGCCEGVTTETPRAISNPPGLRHIHYRAGDHAAFLESMLARLSASGLESLRTRAQDDFTIALLDGWATIGDILTFYQERIANEGYLRTANDRVSIQELAKLIGYSLRPGLAASAYVAFTLDQPPGLPAGAPRPQGVPEVVTLDTGIKVQSTPGPGEQPQTFETIEAIAARIEWNDMRPLLGLPYHKTKRIWLKGSVSTLQQGDAILLVGASVGTSPRLARVASTFIDSTTNRTTVELESTQPIVADPLILGPGIAPNGPVALSDTAIRKLVRGSSWIQENFVALAREQKWPLTELAAIVNGLADPIPNGQDLSVFGMKTKAAIFGHNAPKYESLPPSQRFDQIVFVATSDSASSPKRIPAVYPDDWDANNGLSNDELYSVTLADSGNEKAAIDLDNAYPSIVAGKWIWFSDLNAGVETAQQVLAAREISRNGYAVTGRVTRVQIPEGLAVFDATIRQTRVLAQSDAFDVAPAPLEGAISGNVIKLDQAALWLTVGQKVAVTGQPVHLANPASEVRTIADLRLDDGYTVMYFDKTLEHFYLPETVHVNANIALSTHGDTKQEILGSGNGAAVFQKFVLKQPPLTYISAAVPSGSASTLELRVNGVLWHEVPTLWGAGPRDRVYVTRLDENGNNIVLFGDGVNGARLPTGRDNVQARYRQGLGAAGMVKARQLNQLVTRPLGVKEAVNPLPANGGESPETVRQSRGNAPFTVKTLDRIVSLEDYEDFARASAGITKAMVTQSWSGSNLAVVVTVAGPDGAQIDPALPLHTNLVAAMRAAGDPHIPVQVVSYRPASFNLEAGVKIDPDLDSATVLAAVERALRKHFSFAERGFAQPVFQSEVIAAMQRVKGVIAVNVTALYRDGAPGISPPPEWLPAAPPALNGADTLGAELLTLHSGPLAGLGVMA